MHRPEKLSFYINRVALLLPPDSAPCFKIRDINLQAFESDDVPPEVLMLKELHKGALKGITGTVIYHQAFNEI